MIRNTLLLAAIITATSCLGCIQAGPVNSGPPLVGPPSRHILQTCTPGDPESFVTKVQLLTPLYYPGPPGPYTPPAGSNYDWATLAPKIHDDLAAAFSNAPQFFQRHLCSLKGVYINASVCPNNDPTQCSLTNAGAMFNGSWGFRSYRNNATDLGSTYIAISASDLWQAGGPARPFNDYETQLLKSFPGGSASTVTGANPNASWMSVLAALAHEAGHVIWAVKTIPSVGKKYDFSSLITCSARNFFGGWAYNTHDPKHNDLQPSKRWRKFKNRSNEANSSLDHASSPYLGDLGSSNPTTFNTALHDLYQPLQPWASLFGAQTPDEDFVETYVMAVLTGYTAGVHTFAGPLTNLPVSIPGYSAPYPDVPRDLVGGNKQTLLDKILCLEPL
jgi:hypothetical protein